MPAPKDKNSIEYKEYCKMLSDRMIGKCAGEKNPMYGIHRYGEKAANWQGGRRKDKSGYVLVYFPESHLSDKDGYVREHRLVAEQHLGRLLSKIEVIHHINGIKDDNRPENLYLFETTGIHRRFHGNPHKIISNILETK